MTERIKLQWARLYAYLMARLNEPSSWACGLALVGTATGHWLSPDNSALITTIGLGIAGALKALLPDQIGGGE